MSNEGSANRLVNALKESSLRFHGEKLSGLVYRRTLVVDETSGAKAVAVQVHKKHKARAKIEGTNGLRRAGLFRSIVVG